MSAALMIFSLALGLVPADGPPDNGPPPASAAGHPADRPRSGPPPVPAAGHPADGAHYRWPLAAPIQVVRGFSAPPEPWLRGHRGVDLAARSGDEVLAAGDGIVTFAGRIAGRGVVVVDHRPVSGSDAGFPNSGLRTTYEPVSAKVLPGQPVRAGEILGWIERGGGHCEPLSCLHWGLRRSDRYLDPLTLVRPMSVRLLPLDGSPTSGAAGWTSSALPAWLAGTASGPPSVAGSVTAWPRSFDGSPPGRDGACTAGCDGDRVSDSGWTALLTRVRILARTIVAPAAQPVPRIRGSPAARRS